jgi:uncharacterized protein Veg
VESELRENLAEEIKQEIDNHIIDTIILRAEYERVKHLTKDCDNIKSS